MDERCAMVAAMAADPDEDTTRLAYADWAEEHGESAHAEFIRLQVALSRPPAPKPRRPRVLGLIARTLFPFGGGLLAQSRVERYEEDLWAWSAAGVERRRMTERELTLLHDRSWRPLIPRVRFGRAVNSPDDREDHLIVPQPYDPSRYVACVRGTWRRGFLDELNCNLHSFFILAGRIFRRHPVRRVALTDVLRPVDGSCWGNADAPRRHRPFWAARAPRHSPEAIAAGSLPEPLFRCLPGVAEHHNWIMYPNHDAGSHTAGSALSAALIAFGRARANRGKT